MKYIRYTVYKTNFTYALYLSCDETTAVFVDIIKNLLGGKAAKNLDQDIPVSLEIYVCVKRGLLRNVHE
jgi:hypothetical protein